MAAQNQATDRAHRIGQENTVTVYELIAEHTIEEQIQNLQKSKQDLAEEILSREGISSILIDRDEILKKAQAGAIGMDEREQQVLGLSFGIGGILMVLLCVILAIIRLVNGQDAYDYTAIVFLYLAGAELHLYWRTRRRGLALLAAACGLVFAGNLAVFLLG